MDIDRTSHSYQLGLAQAEIADLKTKLAAALRAPASEPVAPIGYISRDGSEWQPIESAPKDGVGFLACIGKWQTVCCWNKYRGGWCAVGPGYPNYERGEIPTHWMPLPAPPALKTAKGTGE